MATPFFSVIVPVFNRASVLGASLLSVLAQTCQDFEIIVIDDGSSDNPRAVVESLNDPRIRFIRQENQGGGTARNTGINAAQGRFIAPLDSDDLFLPHHLEDAARRHAECSGICPHPGRSRRRPHHAEAAPRDWAR